MPIAAYSTRKRAARSPWRAALLSLLVPGLGHLYVGRPRRAGATFVVALSSATLAAIWSAGIVPRFWPWAATWIVLIATLLFAWIDPAWRARQEPPDGRRPYDRWPVYAFALVLGMALFQIPVQIALTAQQAGYSGLYRARPASMEPTLRPGDVVLIDMTHYTRHPPHRGDVVLLTVPAQSAVHLKRIAALEGDRIAIRDGRAVVNGAPADEPFADPGNPRAYFNTMDETVVPAGHVFVLGDNRAASIDSRSENRFGMIPIGGLKGRASEIALSREVGRIGRWIGTP